VAEIGSIVERTYLSVRDYLDGAVEENDDLLESRLTAVVEQWRRDTGPRVDLAVKGEEGDLSPQVKFQMLQVAREALANVAKHAYSKHVWVDLECTPQQVKIRVRDDGRGFSASGIRGHGMGIMSERAAMAGAELDINSIPGEGTEVVVAYPRDENQGDA
jgi:two-component system nitrate/nitrite sensor histidine kinase NarX